MDISEKVVNEQEIEKIITDGTDSQLNDLKVWLFKENVRLKTEYNELASAKDRLQKEKEQFKKEIEEVEQRLEGDRKHLRQEEVFFSKKLDILKNGFMQLDVDRKRLERERIRLEAEKNIHESHIRQEKSMDLAEMLFQGVNSHLALKKRYKDLMKMFHPDNLAGDHEMVLVINRIYEELKRDYEMGKRA